MDDDVRKAYTEDIDIVNQNTRIQMTTRKHVFVLDNGFIVGYAKLFSDYLIIEETFNEDLKQQLNATWINKGFDEAYLGLAEHRLKQEQNRALSVDNVLRKLRENPDEKLNNIIPPKVEFTDRDLYRLGEAILKINKENNNG